MPRIFKWMEREAIHLLPAILYFEITFILVHFSQSLILQPGDIRFTSYTGAIIGGILAGKIILLAESLPFINAFPNKPILYNIVWKFWIYSFFVLLVQAIDHFTHQLYHTGHWSIALFHVQKDFARPLFWGVQITVLMLFLFFIVFNEIKERVGTSQMRKIFFGN